MGDTTVQRRPDGAGSRMGRGGHGLVSALFVAAALAFGVGAILPRRDSFVEAVASIGWQHLGASAVFSLAGVLLSARVWTCAMRAVGGDFDEAPAARLFFSTQVGKYLPGMVWPYLAQLRFADKFGISRPTMALGQGIFLCVHVATGAFVAGMALPLLAYSQRVPDTYVWLMVPAFASLVVLHPSLLSLLARRLSRGSGSQVDVPIAVGRKVLQATAWMIAVWLLYGAGLVSLVLALAPGSASIWALSVGGFAFAWVVGFLVIVAPAGAGAREVVLAGALATVVTPIQAAAIAVASRVTMTAIDLLLGAFSAVATAASTSAPQLTHQQAALVPPPTGRTTADVG